MLKVYAVWITPAQGHVAWGQGRAKPGHALLAKLHPGTGPRSLEEGVLFLIHTKTLYGLLVDL